MYLLVRVPSDEFQLVSGGPVSLPFEPRHDRRLEEEGAGSLVEFECDGIEMQTTHAFACCCTKGRLAIVLGFSPTKNLKQ